MIRGPDMTSSIIFFKHKKSRGDKPRLLRLVWTAYSPATTIENSTFTSRCKSASTV